ncbi:MAG: GC-type dockerin domain-anchored protein [Phycisphaerales bacterium]
MTRTTIALACLAALAGSAIAVPKAYLASVDGNIYRLTPNDTLELVSTVGQAPVAISAQEDHLVVADSFGRVVRVDPTTGNLLATYQIWHGISATAVTAAPNDQIFVADSTGNISYLDANGSEIDTYYAGMQVSAMLVDEPNLIIGSPNTFILSAPFGDPNFNFISACGGIVNSLVLTPTKLFAGDANGTVYRFDAAGGAYEATFPTATDAKGVALLNADLLVVGSNGTLEHLDPATGALISTVDLAVPVSGIIVADFPCAADTSPDGLLNLDDVNTFAIAFASGDMSADLDASGALNLDDVQLFAAAFTNGCP